MFQKFKKSIGLFVRGARGFFHNLLEPISKLPANLKMIVLGKSAEARPVFAYKFGDGKKKILFMGGIHGNEIGTVKLMHKLINHLQNFQIPPDKTVFVIPIVNPDGHFKALKNPDYLRGGRVGRFNSKNVDLNRNFPTKSFKQYNHWNFNGETISVFCGKAPLSEPETNILINFITNNGIEVLYSFHNRGREIMGNLHELSQKLTKDFAEKTGYKYVSDEDWKKVEQTGTLKEWCDENNIAYVEVEGASRYGSDYRRQKNALINALKYFHG